MNNNNSNVSFKIERKEDCKYPTQVPVFVSLGRYANSCGIVLCDEVNEKHIKYILFAENGYAQTGYSAETLKDLFDILYENFPKLQILDVAIEAKLK